MSRGYGRSFGRPYPGYRFFPFWRFYGLINLMLLLLMLYVLLKLFLVASAYVIAFVILWIIRSALKQRRGFFAPW